ncbi:Muskelin 1, intracellular mediator containing kelch motif [Gonapodya sp. JEL0774]|nr:Muskelin 1, intracellular mediator containing kelch motif [Gonapodya sp. JEL0774]
MGKFVDVEKRDPGYNSHGGQGHVDADFWRWDVGSREWECLSRDTVKDGGPELIYDHQMVVDPETETLFVFGGKTQHPNPSGNSDRDTIREGVYSGLYAYHIPTQRWRLIAADGEPAPGGGVPCKSRIGHSMVLDQTGRRLIIFAGQRNGDYLADMMVYHIPTATFRVLCSDYSTTGGPEPGFTQRATVDQNRREVYVMSGLTRERGTGEERVRNGVWVFKVASERWVRVYQNGDGEGGEHGAAFGVDEPLPRFAHQMGYEEGTGRNWVFGGNPGEGGGAVGIGGGERLDDLWELTMERPQPRTLLRRALFLVRAERLREMCWSMGSPCSSAAGSSGITSNNTGAEITTDPLTALRYLQTEVGGCVDHTDVDESREFREMAGWLFGGMGTRGGLGGGMAGAAQSMDVVQAQSVPDHVFTSRSRVYERLVVLFPEEMREPRESLVDMVVVE